MGDEHHCDGYTRRYYDKQWDLIITDDGEYFWRDKRNHITYKCIDDTGTFLRDGIGEEVDMFKDEAEDAIWDESPEENYSNENKEPRKKSDREL